MDRPLRILFLLFRYPHLAETYYEAEIGAARRLGIEVAVWSKHDGVGATRPAPGVRVWPARPIHEAVAAFDPDVLHLHWMHWEPGALDELSKFKRPLTVRVHTDTTPERLAVYANHAAVAHIFAYSGDRERHGFSHAKLSELPIMVYPPMHPEVVVRDRQRVLRACSITPHHQSCVFDVARLLPPSFKFTLCLADGLNRVGAAETQAEIDAQIALQPGRVEIEHEVPADAMDLHYLRSGIYLHTHTPGKPACMPVSVSQALLAGCYVLVQDEPRLRWMIGDAGATYQTPEEAAALIAATSDWSEAQWNEQAQRAHAVGLRYHADRLMGTVSARWQALTTAPSAVPA